MLHVPYNTSAAGMSSSTLVHSPKSVSSRCPEPSSNKLSGLMSLHASKGVGEVTGAKGRAEQTGAEQSRAEHRKAEQSRAERSRAEQSTAQKSRTCHHIPVNVSQLVNRVNGKHCFCSIKAHCLFAVRVV